MFSDGSNLTSAKLKSLCIYRKLFVRYTKRRTEDLSVNTHVITLTGTDSGGNTDSDNITIYINSVAELILVPGTSGYLMGWAGIRPDEEPVHRAEI